MIDYIKIKKEVINEFLLFCSDEAWPHELCLLQGLIEDRLLEQCASLSSKYLDHNISKKLTLEIINELLSCHRLHTWFPYVTSEHFRFWPISLPLNEVMRRIKAEWENRKTKLSFFECACFLEKKQESVSNLAPTIQNLDQYIELAEQFIAEKINANDYIDLFLLQYEDDYTADYKIKRSVLIPELMNELFEGIITYEQYFQCWHILHGYTPQQQKIKMIIETMLTDCYCFNIQDHSHPNYLDEHQLRIIVNEKICQIQKILDFQKVIYE
jgi:hypothetical protein